MDITTIQNKLIILKNNQRLPINKVKQIQDSLLDKKSTKDELLKLLEEIDNLVNDNNVKI